MEDIDNFEIEAQQLVREHLATNIEQARIILREIEEKREKSDLVILYTNPIIPDYFQKRLPNEDIRKDLIDERVYNYSNIKMGSIPSSALNKILGIEGILVGKIMEFVPKSGDEAKLGALIENFKFQGKEGVFLTDYSEEELLLRGTQPFEEKYPKSLYKIEFHPIRGDYVLGMFSTWNNHNICNHGSLVLWTHKNKVYVS